MPYLTPEDLNLIPQTDQQNAYPVSAPLTQSSSGLNPFLIPDGFSYNTQLKRLPYRIFPMQLKVLDAYRRQGIEGGVWQPRWASIPLDPTIAIEAGDTLNYELHTARGSVLWGCRFTAVTGEEANFRITLTDVCANRVLISQFEIASMFTPKFASGSPSSHFNVVLFAEPIPLLGDADLLINIVNTDTVDRKCQLLLMFFEPYGSPQ